MANPYADLIIALNDVYPKTVDVLTSFRAGVYDSATLDKAKQAIVLYKFYGNKRLALEVGATKDKNILDSILTDLGEAPVYIERNVTLLRKYIGAYDPTYVEPV